MKKLDLPSMRRGAFVLYGRTGRRRRAPRDRATARMKRTARVARLRPANYPLPLVARTFGGEKRNATARKLNVNARVARPRRRGSQIALPRGWQIFAPVGRLQPRRNYVLSCGVSAIPSAISGRASRPTICGSYPSANATSAVVGESSNATAVTTGAKLHRGITRTSGVSTANLPRYKRFNSDIILQRNVSTSAVTQSQRGSTRAECVSSTPNLPRYKRFNSDIMLRRNVPASATTSSQRGIARVSGVSSTPNLSQYKRFNSDIMLRSNVPASATASLQRSIARASGVGSVPNLLQYKRFDSDNMTRHNVSTGAAARLQRGIARMSGVSSAPNLPRYKRFNIPITSWRNVPAGATASSQRGIAQTNGVGSAPNLPRYKRFNTPIAFWRDGSANAGLRLQRGIARASGGGASVTAGGRSARRMGRVLNFEVRNDGSANAEPRSQRVSTRMTQGVYDGREARRKAVDTALVREQVARARMTLARFGGTERDNAAARRVFVGGENVRGQAFREPVFANANTGTARAKGVASVAGTESRSLTELVALLREQRDVLKQILRAQGRAITLEI